MLSQCLRENADQLLRDCVAAARESEAEYEIPINSTLTLKEIFESLQEGIVFQEWEELIIQIVSANWKRMNVLLLRDHRRPLLYCRENQVQVTIARINGRYHKLGV